MEHINNSWRFRKSSGSYRRKVKKNRDLLSGRCSVKSKLCRDFPYPNNTFAALGLDNHSKKPVPTIPFYAVDNTFPVDNNCRSSCASSSDTEEDHKFDSSTDADMMFSPEECDTISEPEYVPKTIDDDILPSETFHDFLRHWAVVYKIRQSALKPLMDELNSRFNAKLPKDPRTLLGTLAICESTPKIEHIDGGQYWHQGLENCLKSWFVGKLNQPLTIEINFNVDGLPLFNSSRYQFWPILANVHEMSYIPTMVVGLFFGQSKPHKIEQFLDPFVTELESILKAGGIRIDDKLLSIKVRAFICDSPARAFIKGKKQIIARKNKFQKLFHRCH